MTTSRFKSLLGGLLISMSFSVIAETPTDIDKIFNDAMEARNSGEILTSVQTFESLLNQQPGLNRVRLELAVSYHMLRRYEDARDQLYKVLNDPGTPDSVRLTITAYLAQLGADEAISKQRTSDSIFVSAGVFTDSNVNIAPSDIVTLQPGERDATGSALLLNYSHKSKSLDPLINGDQPVMFEWNTSATAYSKVHTGEENDFNLHVLSLSTGPQLNSDENWSAALNFKIDKIYFDDNPYADFLSINPLITLHFEDNLSLSIENITSVREFSSDSESGLEGVSKEYGTRIAKIFDDLNMGLEAGVRYYSNGAEDGHLNYDGLEVHLGAYIQAWENGKAFLNLSSRDYEYKNSENIVTGSGSTIIRDETENKAILGASHYFADGTLKDWTLNAQITYTDNDSNENIYDYDRSIVELNFSRNF